MILLLDVGNTRAKWAFMHDDDTLEYGGSVVHNGGFSKEMAEAAWAHLDEPQRIVAANVAGDSMAEALNGWSRARWNKDLELIRAQASAYGVVNGYSEPERLGADRWVALIEIRSSIEAGAACLVDCGSAITVDALSEDGAHLGGLIVPGLQMMRESLIQRAPGIQLESVPRSADRNISLLAKDTRDAVTGGTLYAVVAFIDRVVADLSAELDTDLTRIITGGDAEQILPLLSGEYRTEPDVVLKGLAIIAQQPPELDSSR
jgi:type III pantothenate kinase